MGTQHTVLVIDDQEMLSHLCEDLLALSVPSNPVVITTTNLLDALIAIREVQWSLIVISRHFVDDDGVCADPQALLHGLRPQTPTVLVSSGSDPVLLAQTLRVCLSSPNNHGKVWVVY